METKELAEDIRRRRSEMYSCAETTLTALCNYWNIDIPESQLRAISIPFRGGIGATFGDGTCGALSGAVMAIGLKYMNDKAKSVAVTKEVFNDFQNTYGTVCCGKMYQKGREHCTGCCITAALLADTNA